MFLYRVLEFSKVLPAALLFLLFRFHREKNLRHLALVLLNWLNVLFFFARVILGKFIHGIWLIFFALVIMHSLFTGFNWYCSLCDYSRVDEILYLFFTFDVDMRFSTLSQIVTLTVRLCEFSSCVTRIWLMKFGFNYRYLAAICSWVSNL